MVSSSSLKGARFLGDGTRCAFEIVAIVCKAVKDDIDFETGFGEFCVDLLVE
jgi:hypothetical protein